MKNQKSSFLFSLLVLQTSYWNLEIFISSPYLFASQVSPTIAVYSRNFPFQQWQARYDKTIHIHCLSLRYQQYYLHWFYFYQPGISLNNCAWFQCPCSQGHPLRKVGRQVIMSLYSIHSFLKGFLCVNLKLKSCHCLQRNRSICCKMSKLQQSLIVCEYSLLYLWLLSFLPPSPSFPLPLLSIFHWRDYI